MGGVRWPVSSFAEPDSAHNNSFDMEASRYFYRRCQELGVPLIVVGRDACYEVAAPKDIYEELGNTESEIGKRLRDAAHSTIDDLRRRAASTGAERRGLPSRCDAQWFADNFCHGNPEVLVRPLQESVWDLVVAFNLYDVVALALAVPLLREAFVSPQCVVEVNGVSHCFVGCAPGAPAFRSGKARRACAKLVAEGPLKGHATRCADGDIPAMRDSSMVFADGKPARRGGFVRGRFDGRRGEGFCFVVPRYSGGGCSNQSSHGAHDGPAGRGQGRPRLGGRALTIRSRVSALRGLPLMPPFLHLCLPAGRVRGIAPPNAGGLSVTAKSVATSPVAVARGTGLRRPCTVCCGRCFRACARTRARGVARRAGLRVAVMRVRSDPCRVNARTQRYSPAHDRLAATSVGPRLVVDGGVSELVGEREKTRHEDLVASR